jgi:hypothetical protein
LKASELEMSRWETKGAREELKEALVEIEKHNMER